MDFLKKTETVAYLVIFAIIILLIGFWGSKKSLYKADGSEEYQIKPSGGAKASNVFTPATK